MKAQAALLLVLASGATLAQSAFTVEEATIAGTQKAIQDGKITGRGVVQAYIDRIKAYPMSLRRDRSFVAEHRVTPARS
jgi:hypothetical protein